MKNKLLAGLAVAVALIPGISSAQVPSAQNLQFQIERLLAQATAMQAQLTAGQVLGASTSAVPGIAGSATGTSAIQWCYVFPTNLSTGSTGPAVTALQTALTSNGESVSSTGYFGKQTAAAVASFQTKYSSQILAPNGLTQGNGFVGSSTRGTLNTLFRCRPLPTPTPTPVPPIPAPTSTITTTYITPTSGSVGTLVTVHGRGFAATNTVFMNGLVANTLQNVPSTDGKTLSFVVPPSLEPNCTPGTACPQFVMIVTNGTFKISVMSGGATTQNVGSFTVTNAPSILN